MKQLMMGFAACMLLMTSCTEQDITETVLDGQGQLTFSTGIGKQTTKTAELMNSTLQREATSADKGIALWTYQETTPGPFGEWFDDNLWYSNSKWQINSTRFRNTVDTKFITYYPTTKVTRVTDAFEKADFKDLFPAFTYQVLLTSDVQQDLIAGVTEIEANQSDITIGLRHILSQVNFGTRGYNGAQISIQNIKIEGLYNSATYTYGGENKYPIGKWSGEGTNGTIDDREASYVYYNYSNRSEGDGTVQPTTPDDAITGEVYVFGDGGNWGPGKENGPFYPVGTNYAWEQYDPFTPQKGLENSLMLMPQDFSTDTDGKAKVTFEYKIQDIDSAFVAGAEDKWENGEFKLNFKTGEEPTPDKPDNKYYLAKWEQNFRYLYLIDFTDFLDGSALTFTVDVEAYPWENHNNDGDDDGIINIMAAGQPTPANMNKISNGKTWYIASQSEKDPTADMPWKWAQVIRDEKWNLSTYNFTQIEKDQTIVLSFLNVIFNTKETPAVDTNIELILPDGYEVTTAADAEITVNGTASPYTIEKGKKTVKSVITITNTNEEYSTQGTLATAIGKVTTPPAELIYKGTTAVNLTTMEPGLTTDNDKITVKFNSTIIPTVGATTNGIWTWNATKKIATWTKVTWNSLSDAKTAVTGATADATIYCSDATVITSLATTFSEPTSTTVSTIKVVFSATADRTGDATANGAWTYDAKSKTATWTRK